MGGEATWMNSLNRDPGPYGGAYTPSNMDFLRSGFEPASKAPSAHEHDAALALEGMALGRELHNAIPQSRDERELAPFLALADIRKQQRANTGVTDHVLVLCPEQEDP
jgi:hypothetical protein